MSSSSPTVTTPTTRWRAASPPVSSMPSRATCERSGRLLCVGLALHFLLEGRTHPQMPAGLGVFRAQVQRFDPRLTDEGERPLLTPHAGPSLVVGLDRHPFLSRARAARASPACG